MEAASIPDAQAPPGKTPLDVLRENILWVLFVLALVVIGISDLSKDNGSLAPLGENIKDGISVGTIWALIALGYTLVYGIIELINFAHGEVFMIGSFVTVSMFNGLGLDPKTSIILMVVGIAVSLILAM